MEDSDDVRDLTTIKNHKIWLDGQPDGTALPKTDIRGQKWVHTERSAKKSAKCPNDNRSDDD